MHTRTGSPAIHADIWRLHLLAQSDKIWVDTDVYCYRPFDFEDGHVFGWEKPGLVCNAVLGLPKGSDALKLLIAFFESVTDGSGGMDGATLEDQRWGFTGPHALTRALETTGELSHALPEDVFYPVPFPARNRVILKRFDIESQLSEHTRGIHFWARRLKPRMAEQENNRPRKASFLAKLLETHGIDPDAAPLPGWTPRTSAQQRKLKSDRPTAYLLGALRPDRPTRVVDVSVNPLERPAYRNLFEMAGCELIGFETHPKSLEDLVKSKTDLETYLPYAIGDGGVETVTLSRLDDVTTTHAPPEHRISFINQPPCKTQTVGTIGLETRRLDALDACPEFDLLRIGARRNAAAILSGGEARIRQAVAIIITLDFDRIAPDDPGLGRADPMLRQMGFRLHRIANAEAGTVTNSQMRRLDPTANRNQLIAADAIYLRDLGHPDRLSDEALKHLSILSSSVFGSHDVALFCLDELVRRDAITPEVPKKLSDRLPEELKRKPRSRGRSRASAEGRRA